MFENLRDKLFSPQQDSPITPIDDRSGFDLNAGALLLERYQNDWMILHNFGEENARRAEDVDKMIGRLKISCDTQWEIVGNFVKQIKTLPSLISDLKNVLKKLGELENNFKEVENALISLENTIEIQELQEKQLDERFKLAMYKEKKMAEYETMEAKLAAKHATKVCEYEIRQQSVLRERQATFDAAFQEDLQHYKAHGKIERLDSLRSNEGGLKLEDVDLEQEEEALDAFLALEGNENSTCPEAEVVDGEDRRSSDYPFPEDKSS